MDDPPWVLADGERRTHAAVRERAARAAGGFLALGVREGDAIALLMGNGFPLLEASLAAALAGAAAVPIDRRAAPETIAFVLRDCGARLLVAEADALAGLTASVPVLAGDPAAWADWADRHPAPTSPSTAPPGTLLYTSGTTGRPKGVWRPPAPAGHTPSRALKVYGLDRPGRATVLIDGPLSHSVPHALARLALGVGADIVLRPKPDPEAMLDAIARHRITHLHLAPAMMARLLALPRSIRAPHDVSSLRHAAHGGSPCPPHLRRAMVGWWGPVLHEYYGSTETGLLTFQGSEEALARPGSVGRPLPGIGLHILGPDGEALPPGAVGTVYAGSDTLHRFTYVGRPERRAAIGRGDLVTAGDFGWIAADGALHLCGRARDALRIGGIAVYPEAVAAALLALPGVADGAVFGVAGEDGADVVMACASPRPGAALDPDALRARLALTLAPEEVPRRVAVLDRLPRADTGKLSTDLLRRLVGAP